MHWRRGWRQEPPGPTHPENAPSVARAMDRDPARAGRGGSPVIVDSSLPRERFLRSSALRLGFFAVGLQCGRAPLWLVAGFRRTPGCRAGRSSPLCPSVEILPHPPAIIPMRLSGPGRRHVAQKSPRGHRPGWRCLVRRGPGIGTGWMRERHPRVIQSRLKIGSGCRPEVPRRAGVGRGVRHDRNQSTYPASAGRLEPNP